MPKKEIWKWVEIYVKGKKKSFEGYYRASSFGRLKRTVNFVYQYFQSGRGGQTRLRKIYFEKGPVNIKYYENGRPEVALHKEFGRPKRIRLHILMLETFVGECPEGMEACHKDDDPLNNHIDNLYWGTHFENMQDAKRNGRTKNPLKGHKGETNPGAKLTETDVLFIRKFYEEAPPSQKLKNRPGISSKLAKKFGVSYCTIYRIVNKKKWKDVE